MGLDLVSDWSGQDILDDNDGIDCSDCYISRNCWKACNEADNFANVLAMVNQTQKNALDRDGNYASRMVKFIVSFKRKSSLNGLIRQKGA